MESKNKKPWLDANGDLLSDAKLKQISKVWDAETWELFLQRTVEVERSEKEILLQSYELLLEEVSESFDKTASKVPQHVVNQIKLAKRQLAPQQKQIIELLYWGDLSEHRVAKKLQILRSNVNESKKSSLNKIRDFLESDQATRSYLIGGFEKSVPQERSRDEQIREIYNIDLQGSYIK